MLLANARLICVEVGLGKGATQPELQLRLPAEPGGAVTASTALTRGAWFEAV
jgi:hypothetical protein